MCIEKKIMFCREPFCVNSNSFCVIFIVDSALFVNEGW